MSAGSGMAHFAMHRARFAAVAASCLFACPSGLAAGPLPSSSSPPPASAATLPGPVQLFVGDSRVLELRPARMAVGNGKIVSVSAIGSGQLLLIGESPGSTVLHLWLRDGREHRIPITVSASNLPATLSAVQELLAGTSGLSARLSGHRVVIEGLDTDGAARERAAAIAGLFPGIVLDFVGKSPPESMVMMTVRIVEFREAGLQDLGIRWREEINGPNAGVIADFVTNELFRSLPATPPAVEPGIGERVARIWPPKAHLGLAATLDSRLRLLEQRGRAVVIAEPTLSSRSGGSARFVSGGEIPLPVTNGLGSTDVEYKEYGVILDVRPELRADGRISARVEAELSQIDPAVAVLGVPGFLKRRALSEISLRDGETLVIAGLASRSRARSLSGLPGLVRLPVAGRALGRREQRQEQVELAIFITPRRVEGIAADAPLPDPQRPLLERAREAESRFDSRPERRREVPRAP